jgi:triosephosphate isomerase
MRRKLAAGNWKMNGTTAQLSEISTLASAHSDARVDIAICPPATLITTAVTLTRTSAIAIGAQDCHPDPAGAHTGDISAPMLADAGATYVITGHSERRQDHGESNEAVRAKTRAAWGASLTAILCIGETAGQRTAENTLDILAGQLSGSIPDHSTSQNLVIAYEPIWAIGTGLIPTPQQIGEVHDFIRARLQRRFGEQTAQGIRLLYGGSVNATNATKIFSISNVDGALVGGASLKASDFSPIITALYLTTP